MHSDRHPTRTVWVRLGLVAGLAAALCGCVRRTVTINTDPQGARVILNDEEIGTSPVSVDFLWYGDYDVVIRKDGYQTLQTHHRLNPPWYQVPPFDFFSETLVPGTLHDRQQMAFVLSPQVPPDRDALLEAANQCRERTVYGQE